MRKRIRFKQYHGVLWIVFLGKPDEDDLLSIKIENYYKSHPGTFHLFSILKTHNRELVILNIGFQLYN